ncbi:hypothetical protein CJD92_22340 [Salmonella enterica subsp. enterica serovar Newport]|nr:hypothetical protein [Salmonella enterica subsp. enterica serovar Newport]
MENKEDLSLDMAFKVIDEQRKEIEYHKYMAKLFKDDMENYRDLLTDKHEEIEQLQNIITEQNEKIEVLNKSFLSVVKEVEKAYTKIADNQKTIVSLKKKLSLINDLTKSSEFKVKDE